VSEELFRLAFLSFGEIRNIDIPMLDPYRSDIQVSARPARNLISKLAEVFIHDEVMENVCYAFDIVFQILNLLLTVVCRTKTS